MSRSITTRHRKKTSRSYMILVVTTVVILGYFLFHALNGQYGLVGRERLLRQSAELQLELDKLVSERRELESKVNLLRSENPDRDMVDEQARSSLNFIHPNEIVILKPTE